MSLPAPTRRRTLLTNRVVDAARRIPRSCLDREADNQSDREAGSKMPFPHLFSPIQLGNLELANRVVHVPTDISSSHADGEVSERDIAHHADIARGGAGFIIVGATTPDMKTGRPTVTCLVADGDNYVPGLARLAEAMHRYGAKCAVQLQHPGRQCAIPRYNTLGATDRVLKLPWSAGHEIIYENAEEKGKEIRAASVAEILELVDLFSEAAWRVKQAGFDAVELHAAHGYLLSEFMSPLLNMRTDRFGGSLENRMRFPLAVIDSIQKKCGRSFPVLLRYSFEEWCEGGRGLDEGVEIARMLERAGCAGVDISMGIQESPGAGFDPMHYPQGWATYAAEAVKKVVRIPVITSHSLRDPEYCEQIIAEGKTDLVGLSRQMLADPYWPVKAQYDRVRSIRRCISCLGGCWQESLMAKHEIACSINPGCGNQAFSEMKRSSRPVKVAVVGGGPAGMEAARVATERGHNVTLFERHGEIGGAMLYVCLVPGKEKMRWYLDWIRDQLLELKVDIRLGHAPTVDELRGFDVVVNATGAISYVPEVLGRAEDVIPFEEAMACPKIACECHPGARKLHKLGDRVLIWGDHYAAVDTISFLADHGKEITVVTENREFAAEVEVIHMYVARKRYEQGDAEVLKSRPYKHPVKILTETTVREIREGEVVLQDKEFNLTTIPVDGIVGCHTRPRLELFDQLRAAGIHVLNVGDSVRPRNLYHAVKEGAGIGLGLDEHLLFNPNGAIVNDLPIDVFGQLTRPEEPAYSHKRMLELAGIAREERAAKH
jgi:2,4-dienoyl-CoA reductase-like NADH-dependent reductase (Old Yellow Enzyme family)/thioredoxin reductase